MTKLDRKAAENRLLELIAQGRDQHVPNGTEAGQWSHADFDEIEHLARVLEASLPQKFREIVKQGWVYSARDQQRMAQRLDRVWALHKDYPISGELENPSLYPTFRLTEDDRARVLDLSSKMRKIIMASTLFDDAHKRRLLNRLNAIEKQVHQEEGMLDVILGGVSDVGDTLKKFGGDLKPLSDRMTEIKRITQSSSKEYDQVPAPEELEALPAPETEAE
jgi:hypothetical protein